MILCVFFDTISAVAFGIPSLIDYDTSLDPINRKFHTTLECVYGCPAQILILLANINTWRALRLDDQTEAGAEEWGRVKEILEGWSPTLERPDGSLDHIGRLAIQESWRHAALIYLYMVSLLRTFLHFCVD